MVVPDGFVDFIPKVGHIDLFFSVLMVMEFLQKLFDSAPGPDGVPYSAWVATFEFTAEFVLAALNSLLGGRAPPPGFNRSLMVFLAKGFNVVGSTLTSGAPSCTRPLNFSNTDQKIEVTGLKVGSCC